MQLHALWDPTADEVMSSDVLEASHAGRPLSMDNERLLNLARTLQTTLHLGRLLELFSVECRNAVPFDSLSYRNVADDIDLLIGRKSTHTCSYRLSIGSELLGEIGFTRGTRFEDREIELLEFLGSHLLYPLRNALLYRKALLVAAKDPLTGAFNRATLEQSLYRDVSLARRHGTPFSVIMLDLDHFKLVNDGYGHITGDCVLKAAARLFQECVRDSDTVFRFGGEEFTILLSNSDLEGARQLAERIREAIEKRTITCDGQTLGLTVSAGVAQWAGDESPDQVLLRSDRALYAAKGAGRNKVVTD